VYRKDNEQEKSWNKLEEAMEEHGGKYKLSLNYMWMDEVGRSDRYFM